MLFILRLMRANCICVFIRVSWGASKDATLTAIVRSLISELDITSKPNQDTLGHNTILNPDSQ